MAGRPKKEEEKRKSCRYTIRLTKDESDILHTMSTFYGLNISDLFMEFVRTKKAMYERDKIRKEFEGWTY
jgi:hypothetical protein